MNVDEKSLFLTKVICVCILGIIIVLTIAFLIEFLIDRFFDAEADSESDNKLVTQEAQAMIVRVSFGIFNKIIE